MYLWIESEIIGPCFLLIFNVWFKFITQPFGSHIASGLHERHFRVSYKQALWRHDRKQQCHPAPHTPVSQWRMSRSTEEEGRQGLVSVSVWQVIHPAQVRQQTSSKDDDANTFHHWVLYVLRFRYLNMLFIVRLYSTVCVCQSLIIIQLELEAIYTPPFSTKCGKLFMRFWLFIYTCFWFFLVSLKMWICENGNVIGMCVVFSL